MGANLRNWFSRNVQNLLGWRSPHPVLIIESDDWGSIRMPGAKSYEALRLAGIPVDKSAYSQNDFLETQDDLQELFELTNSFQDSKGNPLCITANVIMANPDFEGIARSRYEKYHYEDIAATYDRHRPGQSLLNLIQEGAKRGIFVPQLHGREHLHPVSWLKALATGHEETLTAFEHGVCGHPSTYFGTSQMNFQSALHLRNEEEMDFGKESLNEGMALFEKYFGKPSLSFIPPRYIWPRELERHLFSLGVRGIQGKVVQLEPKRGTNVLRKRYHYMGQKGVAGVNFLTRNVFFEPAQKPGFPWVEDALDRIRTAFYWNKPAIISMHRINFVNGLDPGNARRNRLLLTQVVKQVQEEFSEVEFISTAELLDRIE